MSDKKQTKVRKGITHKIQTKQYESLEVTTSYEDTIEWKNVEERDQKLNKVSQLALIDFKKTFNAVCDDLGVKEKAGFAKIEKEDGSVQSGSMDRESDQQPQQLTDDTLEDLFDGV